MAGTTPGTEGKIMEAKITKRLVDAQIPGNSEFYVWDREVTGFALRVKPSGHLGYVLRYTKEGRKYQITIGRHGSPWCPESARKEARRLLGDIEEGSNPSVERKLGFKAPTVSEFAAKYLAQYSALKNKPATHRANELIIQNRIRPALGTLKMAAVTRMDIADLHYAMRGTPVFANRVLAVLSKMFSLAEKWEIRPDGSNPCRHIERYPEKPRDRYLSEEEFGNLAKTLVEMASSRAVPDSAITAIWLLLYTGARLNEVLTLRWEQVDINNRIMLLGDSKTGVRAIYLNDPVIEVLKSSKRLSPWVVPSPRTSNHIVNIEKPWLTIRKAAGLGGVRLHDLRHSFASVAANLGLSLPKIGALLGHKKAATTQRYAHLAAQPLKDASDLTAKQIAGAIQRKGATA